MTPTEYFKAIAKELEAVRVPEGGVNVTKVIEYAFSLYESNIEYTIAAELIINKFGYGKEDNAN